MRRRNGQICALLAAALLLTLLAACQERESRAEDSGRGGSEETEILIPTAGQPSGEAGTVEEETGSPAPPPQAVPTPKATPFCASTTIIRARYTKSSTTRS